MYQPLVFPLLLLFLGGFLVRTTIHRARGILYVLGMESLWSQTHRTALIPSTSIDRATNDQPVRPQTQWPPQTQPPPQPQSHAIFPLGSKQSEVRKFTAKDWEELRSEITRLYENNALNKVIELMAEQHGLSAT
jgi:hypothetical protein